VVLPWSIFCIRRDRGPPIEAIFARAGRADKGAEQAGRRHRDKQASALPRRDLRPGDALNRCSPGKLRAQGMPGARTHPLPCVQTKKTHAGQHRYAEITRHSLRNGFTAAPRSPRCVGLFSHRRCVDRSTQLDPSVEGTGPHGLTVRSCAARLAARPRPSQPASRLVTNGRTSLVSRRDDAFKPRLTIYVKIFIFISRTGHFISLLNDRSGVLPVVSWPQHSPGALVGGGQPG
jgi:hypothetical protein